MKTRPAHAPGTTRFHRKPLITALEPRLLLDGAVVATAVELATDVDSQEQVADTTVHSESAEDAVHFTAAVAPDEADAARREVAFVDTQVEDYQTLVAGIAEGVEVFLIDAESNGLEQMVALLQGQSGIDAIHVYSHGDVGQLTLGNLLLDGDNLAQNASLLTQIGETLSSEADLMLYGCYVGADSEGQSFIDGIAQFSGADVAASDDLTGSGALGGDWDLEASAGTIDTHAIEVSSFESLLAPSISGLSNNSFTEGGSAITIDSDVSFSGGANYGNGYIQFQVTASMDTGDQLAVASGGSITLSGSNVYYSGTLIGSIDSTYNGVNGNALRINLLNQTVSGTSPVLNGDFSNGLTNWTAYTGTVDLGVTSIAGWTTPSDNLINYPSQTPGGDDNDLQSGYDNGIVTVESGQLRLEESSLTTSSFGVVHGPAAYSDAFNATSGMVLKFEWQANYIADDYHVVGYLLNTANGAITIALQSYGTTGSGTASVTVPTTGNYRFVFVSGTFDASGGQAAGASMYIDNIRVEAPFVTDTVVTSLARLVTYRNSSEDPTAPTKTITLSARNSLNETTSSTQSVSVTSLNDAPSFTGGASLAVIAEDASSPAGATISSLLSARFSDPDTLNSPADTLAGIAIVGDASSSSQGTWEYSTDSGSNWHSVGSVSGSNALVLSSSTLLRFRPSADWNGTPGSLSVHAADSSHSGGITSGASRVTFDTTTDGSTSAVSAAAVSLSTSVTAVNDAPTLAGMPSDISVTEDVASNLDLSGVTLADIDSTGSGFTLTLAVGAGTLTASSGGSVTVSGSGAGTLTLTGRVSDIDTYLNTASNIKYTGTANTNGNNATTLTLTANDQNGSGAVTLGTANIDIIAVNDLPTIQGLAGATVNEDATLSISGFTIADIDGDTVRIRVQADHGLLSLASSSGLTVSSTGSTLDFSGSLANAGTALNALRYAADANFNGTDDLSVEISDDNGATWQIYTVDQTGKFYNPDNGHYYEFVSASGITWDAAKTAAEARTLYGLNGYLVTVTSAAENDFIYPKLGGNGWMGASDAASEGIWKWVTGPETGTQFWTGDINAGTSSTSIYGSAYNSAYANWVTPGEPNNADGTRSGEDVAHFYSSDGLWNDFAATNTTGIAGYIVEYGGVGYGTLQAAPFSVTVTSVNDVPVFTSSAVSVSFTDTSASDSFSTQSGTLAASDAHSGAINESGTLSYGISGGSDNGTAVSRAGTYGTLAVTKAGGAYSYTPDANVINRLPAGGALSETFTVTVSDGQGGTTSQTFTVQIAPANDTPIVVSPTHIALADSSGASIAGTVGSTLAASDIDTGTTLSYAIDNSGSSVSTLAGSYGTLTLNGSTGAYVYTPNVTALNALDADASDTFTLKVSDGTAIVSTTLTIDVTATAETTAAYTEQNPATAVLTDTVIDTPQSYGGGYIEFALGSSTSSETLGLQRVASASTAAGVVSIVGDAVYLGDGTLAKAIGQVDSTYNGLNGQKLRVNFAIDFANGNFESSSTGLLTSTVGQTITIDGWTVVNDRVTLGSEQHYDYVQKDWIDNTIAGLATPDDPTYPSRNISKISPDSSSILTQAKADNGGTNPYASGMQDFGNLTSTGFYTYVATGAVSNGGSGDSLQMKSSMWSEAGYEVIRGPYVYSTGTVNLLVGDDVSFYWKAEGGSDAYDVFGYIINVNAPSDYQVILNATGLSASAKTTWAQENVVVNSAGEYRFVFVSGTFDATGGEALGAQLYIDDVKVTQAQPAGGVDSSVLEALSRQVTYANSSDLSAANATVSRTITVTTSSGDATPVVHASTKALTLQEVNDPVSLAQPATIRYTDTDAADSFSASSGRFTASDPDSGTAFTFGIVDGGSTASILQGDYGTLTLNPSTGTYTYTPDADAINALSANASDSFTVQVVDGSGSIASRTLSIEILSVNDAPLLGGAASTTTFVENGAAALVDPNITISDSEGTHYGSGSLTFTSTANGESSDRFSILATNGISVSGSNVYAGGTLIGTIDSQYDGQDGRALRINLNADAYSLQVQALARSIAFSNPTDDLSGAARSISIEVNDGGSGGATTARYSARTATMQVSAINDLPEITLSSASYSVEKVIATNPDGTLALTGIAFDDADHTSLSVTLATTRYGALTLRTDVSGGLTAGNIAGNGSQSVTLSGTLAQINATLAASNGLVYVAGSGNDIITPGADALRITAVDAASGETLAQKQVTVLPAVPNADSTNIVTAEDGPVSVDIGAIIADINDNAGHYVFGTGTADLTDAGGIVTTAGSITAFDASKVIYASHDIDGDGDIDASDTSKAIGYQFDHGKLILDNDQVLGSDFATFTYTPDGDWSGVERFVYRYTSGDGTTSYIAETAIYVTAQNDTPELALSATQNIDEDMALVFNNANGNRIALSDVDAGSEAMTLTLRVGHGALTLAGASGLTVLEGSDGSGSIKVQGSLSALQAAIDGLTYLGQQDYNGSDTLTVTFDDLGSAGDGGAKAVTQTVALTVNAVNDNPVGAADAGSVVEAGGIANASAGSSATGNVLTNDTDVDVGDTPVVNGAVTFVRETTIGNNAGVSTGTTSSDGRQVAGLYGALRIGADGSYRYITDESNAAVQALRASGQTLDDRFTYTLADAGGLTAEAVLTVTLDGRNDNPVALDDAATAIETGGILNASAGANATGNVLSSDTDVDSIANSETKSVTAVRIGSEGGSGASGTVGQALTGTYGALTLNADGGFTYVIDESNAAVQALRITGQTVAESFTYTVTDTGGLTDRATITITLDGRNDNPVGIDDAATAIEAGGVFNATTGSDATGNVLSNDTDVDTNANGETKTVSAVRTGHRLASGAAGTIGQALTGIYGNLTLNADGSYTYVIDEGNIDVQALRLTGQTLQDRFTYTVTDTGGLTDQATLTLTLDGRNDTPVADAVSIDHTWPFGKMYALDISSRFSDVDSADNGEDLDFSITGLPDGLTYNAATGMISGTPSDIGAFSIIMTASDRAGASVTRQFILEVLAPPQAPAAPPVADAPPPASPPPLDTTLVTSDTTPLPTGTMNAGVQNDPVQDAGYLPSETAPAEAGNTEAPGNGNGLAPLAEPNEGRSTDGTAAERILIAEGNTRVSETVNPDGRVTSVRASVQVEVDTSGQVVFSDVQKEAFNIVGLSVASISSDAGGLSVSIADAARGQDTQVYTGELGNGEQLPEWIKVNETTGEITISNPPPNVDEVTIRVKAISSDGSVRMLDTELNLDELLKRKEPKEVQPDSADASRPTGFVPLAEQVAAELTFRDNYGERLIALLEAA